MNGAEALLELFRAQGTDYIFCSPIAAWAPFWEALAKRRARLLQRKLVACCSQCGLDHETNMHAGGQSFLF
jgi:hypothetical protein